MNALLPFAPFVYLRETLAETTKTFRMPQFLIPTIAMPVGFYALFAIGIGGGNVGRAAYLLATYGVFCAMGPALFGFGAGVASERETGQLELKRLSPMPAGAHVTAKLLACLLVTAIAQALIYALGVNAGVRFTAPQWAMLVAVHWVSVVPFALIGLGIGYRFGQRAAVAIANILFLALAVMGGLWLPIQSLPSWMQQMAWALPSYHLGELALMAAGLKPAAAPWLHGALLGLITLAGAIFALTGQRRASH